ncbi:protein Tob1-like [Limulus polyphemus]|uniref:Protein Tob1-like n=1 Tax=Limulus polyphemus TaxID=6850 RepID=A0ABM1B771_LIMPO|nr:protein Tob1-like [Limulus polyphemus]
MHVEVQVALNFLISFLYNKLPRRRVNQFGEELEKALRQKFQGHWYPDKPMKGSAYRCLKTTLPLDPVFEEASLESGVDLRDIQENLPKELSIWIDPGEVSYRLGEKGTVKGLYSEPDSSEENSEHTFNPEAQCFKPIDSVASQLGGLSLKCTSTAAVSSYGSTPSPAYKSNSPVNGFIQKTAAPLTFTTATFAQTKFGSTKLKSNSKRSHRLSPTEFGSSVKQRVMMQQVQQLAQQQQQFSSHPQTTALAAAILAAGGNAGISAPQRPRSLSPNSQPQLDANFLLMASLQQSQFTPNTTQFPSSTSGTFAHSGVFDVNMNGYTNELFGSSNINASASTKINSQSLASPTNMTGVNNRFSFFDKPFGNTGNSAVGLNLNLPSGDSNSSTFGVDPVNLNLGGMSYANQYQHLLVAN